MDTPGLGIDLETLHQVVGELTAIEYLKRAREMGFAGVHFSVSTPLHELSPGKRTELRRVSDDLGLYLELGMGACNPYSECRAREEEGRSPAEVLSERICWASEVGAKVVRTFFGFTEERWLANPGVRAQLDATAQVLKGTTRIAQDMGVTIALENHMDLTAGEFVDFIRELDSVSVGVCLDTANPLVLAEDPLEVTKKLLQFVATTHVKDAGVRETKDGAEWFATPLGEGLVKLRSIVQILTKERPQARLNLEDHPGIFSIPFRSEKFLTSTGTELSRVEAYFQGLFERPVTYPGSAFDRRRLEKSRRFAASIPGREPGAVREQATLATEH